MTEQKRIEVERKVLSENDRVAHAIRERLRRSGVLALNLVSSPGSGKTSLLAATVRELGSSLRLAVIAGDVQTDNDAQRLIQAGGRVVRAVITGGICHLDARMTERALQNVDLDDLDILFIENVGNLVCPSSYDLGEEMKVVLMSTTEGDDKPLKYPAMFRRSSVLVINKIDLLGLSDFELDRARQNALQINGELNIIELSCRSGRGLEAWFSWLRSAAQAKRSS
jgi:hydrogenase nickel incorporation protein HypB